MLHQLLSTQSKIPFALWVPEVTAVGPATSNFLQVCINISKNSYSVSTGHELMVFRPIPQLHYIMQHLLHVHVHVAFARCLSIDVPVNIVT